MSIKSLIFAISLLLCSFHSGITHLNDFKGQKKLFCPKLSEYQVKFIKIMKCGYFRYGVSFGYPNKYVPGAYYQVCGFSMKEELIKGKKIEEVTFQTYKNQCEACKSRIKFTVEGPCPKLI